MRSLQSFLRKGVSLGHAGRSKNLKDLKDTAAGYEGIFGRCESEFPLPYL